jgi:ABC-type glycerol-3-phosphate transport system substrate-binding protein
MRRMRVFVVVTCAAAVAAACSGSDSKSESAPDASLATVATTTTVKPKPTTTTISKKQQAENDAIAIRHQLEYLNDSYRVSVPTGLNAEAASNYDVLVGLYTASQCVQYRSQNNGTQYAENLVLQQGSVQPAPGWVEQAGVNTVPKGRIYSFTVDATETYVPTALQTRKETQTIHATVLPDGTAKMFFACK